MEQSYFELAFQLNALEAKIRYLIADWSSGGFGGSMSEDEMLNILESIANMIGVLALQLKNERAISNLSLSVAG